MCARSIRLKEHWTKLIGMEVSVVGHGGSMIMLNFSRMGSEETMHLHVLCAWRVLLNGEFVVGTGDQWSTQEKTYVEDLAFRDSLALLEIRRGLVGLVVAEAGSTLLGDVRIVFTSGHEFQCFVVSGKLESWRLFVKPWDTLPHLVWEAGLTD